MTTGFAVTAGWDLPVADASHVHAAVAMAAAAAAHAGLTPADRASCALIATELATNLARHARDGQLVASATEPGPAAWVQLAALDSGPGIPDVDAAMADGYSTANSLGGGLGACRRAARMFDLYTAPGAGTTIIARIGPGSPITPPSPSSPVHNLGPTHNSSHTSPTSPRKASTLSGHTSHIRVGGILAARPGERESGDAWGVLWRAGTITVVIMDGLGHGPEAAQAAANGLRELAVPAGADDPLALLGRLDRRLAGGRGAVAAVARMSSDEFSFSGIGNIGARLGSNGASAGQGSRPDWAGRAARPAGAHGLVSSMGTLGLGQRLRPQAFVAPWREHSLFTAHTDGVRSSWDLSRYPGLTGHDPAVMAALIWRDAATRGDDAAVVVTVAATRPAINEPATNEPAAYWPAAGGRS
jgi:anti-sigma regulatory factor (Ser/Thr protein kinase)